MLHYRKPTPRHHLEDLAFGLFSLWLAALYPTLTALDVLS